MILKPVLIFARKLIKDPGTQNGVHGASLVRANNLHKKHGKQKYAKQQVLAFEQPSPQISFDQGFS